MLHLKRIIPIPISPGPIINFNNGWMVLFFYLVFGWQKINGMKRKYLEK